MLVTATKVGLAAGSHVPTQAYGWHTTRNLSDSVSYNVRIINSSNAGRALWRHLQGIPALGQSAMGVTLVGRK
jgi:hypothetical protein